VISFALTPKGCDADAEGRGGIFQRWRQSVSLMLACYALEDRSHWFMLAFAGSCALSSVYGFLQGAWPFGVVETVWSIVALRRWWLTRQSVGTAD
jgi:hypothetical protein